LKRRRYSALLGAAESKEAELAGESDVPAHCKAAVDSPRPVVATMECLSVRLERPQREVTGCRRLVWTDLHAADRIDRRMLGIVENGFDAPLEKKLGAMAEKLKSRAQPLTKKVNKPKAVWLKPEILVEVEYRALTGDKKVRHPSFIGFREDL
jgi:hypothetical protein